MRRRTLFPASLVLLACLAQPATAQQVPDQLTLADAIELARQNNPGYQAVRNDIEVADWNVRAAWGALAPSASLGGNVGWRGAGEQNFGGITASELGVTNQPNYYSSGYNASVNWGLSGQNWYGPQSARAGRAITASQIDAARLNLETQVTRLYLDVLRQREGVTLATQQLERAQFNFRIAEAQAEVGSGTLLDVRQSAVQVGRSEVAVLQSQNALATARLRLMQQLGVSLNQEPALVSAFELQQPDFEFEALYDEAVQQNPTLDTRRNTVTSNRVGVKIAKSSYLPSLSFSTGLSGFAREASDVGPLIAQAQASVASQQRSCQSTNELYSRLANPFPALDCTKIVFTDAQRDAIVSSNNAFPFDFTRSPPSATLSISIPVFQGLSRQQRLESAGAQLRDAEFQVREQELALEADLSVNLALVETAFRSAEIERRNQQYADEQLRLATERYQLGGLPFLDLVDAETVKAQADRDLLNAVYAYHDAITNLEAVVGRPLRNR